MSTVPSEAQTLTHVGSKVSEFKNTATSLLSCLIVSANPDSRKAFQTAAVQSSWNPILCSDSEEAMIHLQKNSFSLAVIDIDSAAGNSRESLRAVSERLARNKSHLLIICGPESDALEEIWARQLGTWLYLPGLDSSCDIAPLYDEARFVIEKNSSAIPASNETSL